MPFRLAFLLLLGLHLAACAGPQPHKGRPATEFRPQPPAVQAVTEAQRSLRLADLELRFGAPRELLPALPEPKATEKVVPLPAKAPETMVALAPAPKVTEERAKPVPVAPKAPTRPSVIPGVRSVLVVGDSFAVGIGQTMANSLKGMGVSVAQKGKVSSGLNSPKFYDWEQKLTEFIAAERPDVLVAMISGNDAHNGSGSEAWKTAYAQRVKSFVGLATGAGVGVYMVGLPPMGDSGYSDRARQANQVVRDVCSGTGQCRFVDAWSLFADEGGAYTREKRFGDKTLALRAKDGVHLTMNGYTLLTNSILDSIARGSAGKTGPAGDKAVGESEERTGGAVQPVVSSTPPQGAAPLAQP